MLYSILYGLKDHFSALNVFKYITVRAALASVTAFALSLLLTPLLIKKLYKLKAGQSIRKDECPPLYPLHKHKEGTPTMGGILIIVSIVLSTILWADMTNKYTLLVLFVTVSLAAVGFMDDYLKIVKGKSLGLTMSMKLVGQIAIAIFVALKLYMDPTIEKAVTVPFFKHLIVDIGIFYIFFVIFVLIGSSNAVNLTDGLDGLAIGCTVMVALTYAVFSYIAGHIKFSDYLMIFYVPGAGELTVFMAAMFGAGLGFLWYNSFPATLFMGDTGSLALGGAIGAVAVFVKQELVLVLVGGIFVAEALSVIIQVVSFKTTGRRVFKVAPLHHHFQVMGLSEPKITMRFLIVAVILALVSISTLKLR
ncbi:MAG: phospho-N-acetylmuramoyl-pentapeptide-transferase [Candidatus Omnitrophica bacterium CG1_02_49_10]|nr:MAG: phospho-N-acetylmuramoyl-pentapeptide-transferase [Candidatus Omnitrophica bacterium CG1_02_49_10]